MKDAGCYTPYSTLPTNKTVQPQFISFSAPTAPRGTPPRSSSTHQTMRAALVSRRLHRAQNTCQSPVRLTRHWPSAGSRRCLSTDQTVKADRYHEELRESTLHLFVCNVFYAFCALPRILYAETVLSEAMCELKLPTYALELHQCLETGSVESSTSHLYIITSFLQRTMRYHKCRICQKFQHQHMGLFSIWWHVTAPVIRSYLPT